MILKRYLGSEIIDIMLTKSKLKEQIENLPEEFTLEELIDNLIFIEKLQEGLKQSEDGKVISTEVLETKMNGWFE